jgi:hypothetical protein
MPRSRESLRETVRQRRMTSAESADFDREQQERRIHYVDKSTNTMHPFLVMYIHFLHGRRPTVVNYRQWRETLIADRTIGDLILASGGNQWHAEDYVRYTNELLQDNKFNFYEPYVPNNATGLSRKKKRKKRTRRRSFI